MAVSVDFIQESAPERLELKTELHRRIDQVADPAVVIASSTSGLLPSEFQSRCRHPEQILVGHPFNLVYLLPLVEVVAGERTAEASIERAIQTYTDLGMHPLRVRKEVPGFVADRLAGSTMARRTAPGQRRCRNSRRTGCRDFLWARIALGIMGHLLNFSPGRRPRGHAPNVRSFQPFVISMVAP